VTVQKTQQASLGELLLDYDWLLSLRSRFLEGLMTALLIRSVVVTAKVNLHLESD